MYYSNEQNHCDNVELTYQLLRRYLSLGCTLNESLMLSNQTLNGEKVIISSDGNVQNQPELDDLLDPSFLIDYLFYDTNN